MTDADRNATIPPGSARFPAAARTRRAARGRLGVAIAALIVAVILFFLFPGVVALPFLIAAVLLAGASIVLSLTAGRSKGRGGAGWALATALVALAIDAALVVTLIVAAVSSPRLTPIELRAQGGPTFSATFSDDYSEHTEQWHNEGTSEFNTRKSSVQITVTAPNDGPQSSVSCQILWNDEIVADEKSDSGRVTCRYEAN